MGSLEFNVVITLLFFNFFVGIGLNHMVPDQKVEDLTKTDVVNNIYGLEEENERDEELELGFFGSIGWNVVWFFISLTDLYFMIFGVDIIGGLTILPSFISATIILLNYTLLFSMIMYLVNRFWVG